MGFPKSVRSDMGIALFRVPAGRQPVSAKVLKGFGGAGVLELRENDEARNTYRTVYTVKFAGVVYVLHAFQKKSKRAIATPKQETDLIKARLKQARAVHRKRSQGDG